MFGGVLGRVFLIQSAFVWRLRWCIPGRLDIDADRGGLGRTGGFHQVRPHPMGPPDDSRNPETPEERSEQTMKRKVPSTLSGQLRWHLQRCGESPFALERVTGVDNAAIGRFIKGQRGLSLTTADKLAKHLGLRLVRIDD